MAQGRFVARTIATDKSLSLLSLEAEYLFLKTIPHLDRDGLILADVLWSTVSPRRQSLSSVTEDLWREWVDRELAIAYAAKEGTVLYFPGFLKNQQGMRYDREAPSRYEPPPGFIRTDKGLTPDELRMNSGLNPPQVKGQEQVKGQVEVQEQQQQPTAADKLLVVVAMEKAGILSLSHDAILKANPDLEPRDVDAYAVYVENTNTARNGNPLTPAFIVSELKAGHRAPDDCYAAIPDPTAYQPFVLE